MPRCQEAAGSCWTWRAPCWGSAVSCVETVSGTDLREVDLTDPPARDGCFLGAAQGEASYTGSEVSVHEQTQAVTPQRRTLQSLDCTHWSVFHKQSRLPSENR